MQIHEIKNLISSALSPEASDYWINSIEWNDQIVMFQRYYFDDGLTQIEARDAVVKEIELLAIPPEIS